MATAHLSFDASELVRRHPPRFQHKKKRILFDLIAPPNTEHRGVIQVSRHAPADLPDQYDPSDTELELHPATFDYCGEADHWYLNFAHHDLFAFYGGPLFAQDEIQVAEHPALGSLREALIESPLLPLTVEDARPTPILIRGVERHASVDTRTIYGQRFTQASEQTIASAVRHLKPPTISNILAIEAPYGARGRYTSMQIEGVLETAFSGFLAANQALPQGIIHTGFWGCGAYGGNRTLMPMLQIAAARMARTHRLVFHAVDPSGAQTFAQARARLDELTPTATSLGKLISTLTAQGFEWGLSDGN